jgi:ABC-type transport system involved in multi-copper enzyme maturation permease subunit
MLLTIVIREIFESIYNYRFLFFMIIGVTLIPIGIYVNEVNYSKRLGDYDEQKRLENKALSSSQKWDVISGTVPIKGFLEPSPLVVFAQGLSGSLPQFYWFKPGGYEKGAVPSSERSVPSELGKLDFAFMVQLVISLVVLIFGADVVSGEKELGTLRCILSNSVPRDTVLLGKLIGGYVAIWFPFALAFAAGIFVLSLTSSPLSETGIIMRILLIFVTSSLFVLVYFSIGVMVSSGTSRTRTSLIAVFIAWTFLQLIVPKVSGMIAALIYPIETETVVSMEKSLAMSALENEKSRVLGRQYQHIFGKDSVLSSGNGSSPNELEWNLFREKVIQDYKEKETMQSHSMDEAYERENGTQQNIEVGISLVSPSAAFDYLITDLCNTGISEKGKYVEAVRNYQQMLDRELFNLVERTTLMFPSGRSGAIVLIGDLPDLNSLPSFSVPEPGLSEIFGKNVGSFVSLAFWLIVPFVVAYRKFLRYDVR